MLKVIGCITQEHDWRLLILAACLCVLACSTTVNLLAASQHKQGRSAIAYLIAASVVFGCGVWSLHFVAMLAFASRVPLSYGISLTVFSIVVAVAGTLVSFAVWRFSPSRRVGVAAGGILLGLAVAGMHFFGVLAMQVSGTVTINAQEIVYACAIGFGCSIVALYRSDRLSVMWRRAEVAAILTLAVCGLHLTAMTGLSIEPGLPNDSQNLAVLGSHDLAIMVGSLSLVILIMSLAATLVEQNLSLRAINELRRIRTLSDVSQEILIICRDNITLQVNAAGLRIFGASEEQLVRQQTISLIAPQDRRRFSNNMQHPDIDSARGEVGLRVAGGKVIPAQFSIGKIEYEGEPATVIALLDMSDRKRDEARIQHMAYHDNLTDLPNRAMLRDRIDHAINSVNRSGHNLVLLCLDLDRFKHVNDLFGHAAGDELLTLVAARLKETIRANETLARVGGDEFVVVAIVENREHIAVLAQRLIETLNSPFMLTAGQVEIGVSIGIAVYPDDGTNRQELTRTADLALYRVKHEERGTYRFFEPSMDESASVRRRLEHDLRCAIESHEFRLHYQPLVNGRTGDVEGFEALLRWDHPQRGIVPPDEFIALAEETGLILSIGEWVLETACATAAKWLEPHRVAVNISPVQFLRSDLPAIISSVLARTGLPASRLEIEITEGVLMKEPRRAADVLRTLRQLGVLIAMDDFGTGYSSLSYLHKFEFDKLKIDRSFVNRLGEAEDATMIIRTIIGLAHNLNLSVVAEGVETPQQLLILRDLGCDQVQGFLVGRPMQMENPTELIAVRARAGSVLPGMQAMADLDSPGLAAVIERAAMAMVPAAAP